MRRIRVGEKQQSRCAMGSIANSLSRSVQSLKVRRMKRIWVVAGLIATSATPLIPLDCPFDL